MYVNQTVMSMLRKDGGELVSVYCRDTRDGREFTLQGVPRDLGQLMIEAKYNFAEVVRIENH